jgi:hypothetical protein
MCCNKITDSTAATETKAQTQKMARMHTAVHQTTRVTFASGKQFRDRRRDILHAKSVTHSGRGACAAHLRHDRELPTFSTRVAMDKYNNSLSSINTIETRNEPKKVFLGIIRQLVSMPVIQFLWVHRSYESEKSEDFQVNNLFYSGSKMRPNVPIPIPIPIQGHGRPRLARLAVHIECAHVPGPLKTKRQHRLRAARGTVSDKKRASGKRAEGKGGGGGKRERELNRCISSDVYCGIVQWAIMGNNRQ